ILVIHYLGRNTVCTEVTVVVYRKLKVGPVPLVVTALVYRQVCTGTVLPIAVILPIITRRCTQFVHRDITRFIVIAAMPVIERNRLLQAKAFGYEIQVLFKPQSSREVTVGT